MEIFDPTMSNIESAMARSIKIQEVTAHNIANAQTPGFTAKKFDEVLNKAVEREENKTVNLEEEMAEMAKNNTRYSTYAKLMSAKLAVLRNVISQGRK
ncbi:MAG: flagellar basal body protein [Candidatus Saganbacteria bacterium]|nr:flagellar basal body protein [Candidatus Saganbacteria bacterium]